MITHKLHKILMGNCLYLSCEIFKNGSTVHRCCSSHSPMTGSAGLQMPVDTTHRELQKVKKLIKKKRHYSLLGKIRFRLISLTKPFQLIHSLLLHYSKSLLWVWNIESLPHSHNSKQNSNDCNMIRAQRCPRQTWFIKRLALLQITS